MLGTVDIYKHKTSLWYTLWNKHINNEHVCNLLFNIQPISSEPGRFVSLNIIVLSLYYFPSSRIIWPLCRIVERFFVYLFISNLVELFCLSRLWFQCSLFCLFRKHPIWYLILSFLDREMLLKVCWRMLLQKF